MSDTQATMVGFGAVESEDQTVGFDFDAFDDAVPMSLLGRGWAAGYDDPVVYQRHTGALHRAKLDAPEPAPTCSYPLKAANGWRVGERDELAITHNECTRRQCSGPWPDQIEGQEVRG